MREGEDVNDEFFCAVRSETFIFAVLAYRWRGSLVVDVSQCLVTLSDYFHHLFV